MDADGDENCSLIQGHTANKNPQLDDDNLDLPDCSAKKCKVYKRRWYILFVFTLTSIVSNFMWNTWGPIQRPCRVVFGWQTWTVLLLSSFGAIGPILGFIPSTWLMDTKGITSLVLLHFYYLSWPHSLPWEQSSLLRSSSINREKEEDPLWTTTALCPKCNFDGYFC